MKRPLRTAFTVVELLVVIAVIGVLIALLLPAVQAARETARRAQCASHLKQIAMGSHSHHQQWEFFPNAGGGWFDRRKKAPSGAPYTSRRQDWGAFYQILPFIEQKDVYELRNDDAAAGVAIKIYFCPSRRKPQTLRGVGEGGLTPGSQRGQIDYAGNGGSGYIARTMTQTTFPSTASFNEQNGTIIPRNTHRFGLNNETITLGTIKDGAAYTMLFGERNFNWLGNSQAYDENNGYYNGWDWDTIRWSYASPAPDRRTRSNAADRRFGSSHPLVFNAAMADGSVKAIPYNIDLIVFRNLTVRNDGKSPQLP